MSSLDIVVLGLSMTSSWGNGHATTYRGLLRELAALGHSLTFLERDLPFYAQNRDLPHPPFCKTLLYGSVEELYDRFTATVRNADVVIVGSYVPDGIAVGDWVQSTTRGLAVFYDIDTPVTLSALETRRGCPYLDRRQIPDYELYLSFTGGPTLTRLERELGAPRARALFCSVDPQLYFPSSNDGPRWDLGYLGTYSADRQPTLDAFLVEPARHAPDRAFVVAGPQYPDDAISWPANVERITHLSPAEHHDFYNALRFTLNVTRRDMIVAGHSPSVRLFEAALCATPVISDVWPGIEQLFEPGREILLARRTADVRRVLSDVGDHERDAIGRAARARVLAEHTAAHRAQTFLGYVSEVRASRTARRTERHGTSTTMRGNP